MSPLDELRNNFRESFGQYIREGNALRDLLLAAQGSPIPGTHMSEQQARLTNAQNDYETARALYVEAVLMGPMRLSPADE